MELKTLYRYFFQHPEGQWIMKWPNAIELYEYIKNNNFKKILDLGTGIGLSASVVALAMKDKGEKDFHIDTIEQFEKCVKIAEKLIPKEFHENTSLYQSDPIVWNTEKIPYQSFSIFKELPEGDYDFIINDGPGPFLENENYIELPNGTIIKMLLENKLKKGVQIMYDGRIESLRLLERYYGDNFALVKVATHNNNFNVIERRDNEVSFKDDKLEAMKLTTRYFNPLDEKNPISSNKSGSPSSPEALA